MESPKNEKSQKWKKKRKMKKLMFLSGTLPAGAFFFVKKNIFRQNLTFPVKIETFPVKILLCRQNRNFPWRNRNFPWRNRNLSFQKIFSTQNIFFNLLFSLRYIIPIAKSYIPQKNLKHILSNTFFFIKALLSKFEFPLKKMF